VSEVMAKVHGDLGNVDVLVNDAGVAVGKNILDLSEADIRHTIEVNTVSLFWVRFSTVRTFIQTAFCGKVQEIFSLLNAVFSTAEVGSISFFCASQLCSNLHQRLICDK